MLLYVCIYVSLCLFFFLLENRGVLVSAGAKNSFNSAGLMKTIAKHNRCNAFASSLNIGQSTNFIGIFLVQSAIEQILEVSTYLLPPFLVQHIRRKPKCAIVYNFFLITVSFIWNVYRSFMDHHNSLTATQESVACFDILRLVLIRSQVKLEKAEKKNVNEGRIRGYKCNIDRNER